jgi:hypothetical protein
MPQTELDRMDPDAGEVIALSTGREVQVVRLQTRQLFRLLKVLTHGGAEALIRTLDFSKPTEVFTQQLLMMVLFSIPDAENEAISFIQAMVRPKGIAPPEVKRRTKKEVEDDDAAFDAVRRELFNPPIEDTISIIEVVIRQESEDIQSLGKRLTGLFSLASRTGQLDSTTPEPPPTPAQMAAATA